MCGLYQVLAGFICLPRMAWLEEPHPCCQLFEKYAPAEASSYKPTQVLLALVYCANGSQCGHT